MDTETREAIEPFIDFSLITQALYPVKAGKEATVWACKAHPDTGTDLLAVKIYKHIRDRSFRNDAVYQENRLYGNSRERRAYENSTEFGLEVHFMLWVSQEWEQLNKLYDAGVYVPKPIKQVGGAILMEFFGHEGGACPTLQQAAVPAALADGLWRLLKSNIEMMLQANVVHGDLSPYNVLVDLDEPSDPMRIIDVPQAVDARFNPNARQLLDRDVLACYRYFEKLGVRDNPKSFANSIWNRWKRAEL